jgi:2,4-dienoyl-CoA reductase (NADPH2)
MTSCLVNPQACHETELRVEPTTAPRRIAVVGAGPAGMSVAMTAAGRGHAVTLFERAGQVGGQLNLARQVPGKEEFHGLVDWFATMLDRTGVQVRLNTEATVDALSGFDRVIIATGVVPRDPAIPGQDRALSYIEVLNGAAVGPRVALIGAGGIGFDLAEYLTHQGVSPTLDPAIWRREWGVSDPAADRGGLTKARSEPPAREVWLLQRRAEKPGRNLGKTTGWIHRASLASKGVRMMGGVSYDSITEDGLWITRDGKSELLAVDTVVLCAGQVPERGLANRLTAAGIMVDIIGGADVAAELDAKRAIDQGVRLAAVL